MAPIGAQPQDRDRYRAVVWHARPEAEALRGIIRRHNHLYHVEDRPEIVTTSSDGTLRIWRDDLPRESKQIMDWLSEASNATIAATAANSPTRDAKSEGTAHP